MAGATTTPTPTKNVATSGESVADVLGIEGEMLLDALIARVGPDAVALAWSRGEIELGKTKYVVSGNPDTAITAHNGIMLPPPTVIVEGGIEWSGKKERWHAPFKKINRETLPYAPRYQKYQLEVCTNKEKDVWEWLAEGQPANGRETRYARRDITRAEAEKLFETYAKPISQM